MPLLPDEQAISLDRLDNNLRAILKIKIREFLHLNPAFNCIPSIDVASYCSDISASQTRMRAAEIPVDVRQSSTERAVQDLVETTLETSQSSELARYLDSLELASRQAQKTSMPSGEMTLPPRTFFAGYDQDCPNLYRPAPPRRRHARRAVS